MVREVDGQRFGEGTPGQHPEQWEGLKKLPEYYEWRDPAARLDVLAEPAAAPFYERAEFRACAGFRRGRIKG